MTPHRVKLYSLFHLNMSFSSIEESERPIVVEKCYWPLLRLIDKGFPLAIEATGLTLEIIQSIDPMWIEALRNHIADGKCEFVGSGYAQIIAPLVPYEVNSKNLELGMGVYKTLLGVTPELGLINEMAYGPSLVDLYLDAGYKAILMDWANPYKLNIETWRKEWRFFSQKALGNNGRHIDLIWLDSVPFQIFQRYAHGELNITNMYHFIREQGCPETGAFPFYGNDAEIFDYRPRRFETESALKSASEWQRLEELLIHLAETGEYEFINPSDVLSIDKNDNSHNLLRLENADDPNPVKKQPKYNIMRWAASGRDDVWLNTACWRLLHSMKTGADTSDEDWKDLCRVWRSDHRTHITDRKWSQLTYDLDRLGAFEKAPGVFEGGKGNKSASRSDSHNFTIQKEEQFLHFTSPTAKLSLRLMRGLAIEGLWPVGDEQSVVRTLPQGYFSDINFGADYYSAHMTAQFVGTPQVTDLGKVDPKISIDPSDRFVDVDCQIETFSGPLLKRIRFFADRPRVEVSYKVDWLDHHQGSVRFANITLNPAGFNRGTLFFATHNGGPNWDVFDLSKNDVDHGRQASFLVSSRAGLGMTKGELVIGDHERQVLVECPREFVAMPAIVTCKTVDTWKGKSFFARVALSAQEIDDTSNIERKLPLPGREIYHYALTALAGSWDVSPSDT